ncbi:mechanosensitive ion channel [Alteraurantiacibacter aquimixticola]|uniref:Mechanosensitive ion channel n=1 Tax=Alteraurantiacibacter aquimixticola TaxID=2489173 RepID=A0A4T3F2Y7_9SPHN|nr:mechanosensitive ion channel [Alteraurantiacibacter aquimixticola]TIX51091.1 hypothetical protein E5222_00985 [Alteraurantiacibacter aquimixticola]
MRLGRYRFDQDLAIEIAADILLAIAIVVVTWLLARAAKWAFAKIVDNVSFLQKDTSSGESIGMQLGKIVSMLIWLLGLLAVLQVFDLGGVMRPVTTLLDSIMGFIPHLIGAGLIFFIGLMIARILRDLTVTALQTVDFDKWANRGGVDNVTGNAAISKTIGTIVFVLVIIPVSIAALEALDIETISGPASEMLQMIFGAIPRIIGAAILLGLGYLIARFAGTMLADVLRGLGVDRSLESTGLLPANTSASRVIGNVVQVAIILFIAIAATRLLGFPELTVILDEILELGGRVVFGAVVIGAGFLIAGLLGRIIGGEGGNAVAGSVVKWAAIVLFTFMGLQFMGVGEEIVQTAFSAIVIGGAVAAALAFGLGGREWAARKLEQADEAVSRSAAASSSSGSTPATTAGEEPADLPPGA